MEGPVWLLGPYSMDMGLSRVHGEEGARVRNLTCTIPVEWVETWDGAPAGRVPRRTAGFLCPPFGGEGVKGGCQRVSGGCKGANWAQVFVCRGVMGWAGEMRGVRERSWEERKAEATGLSPGGAGGP